MGEFNGRVGIGTTTPQVALHIRAPTAAVTLEDTRVANAKWSLYAQTNNSIKLFRVWDATAYVDRFDIDENGNVGIGIMFPTQKLDVNGTIRCVSLIQTSDEQLKSDIQPLEGVLDKLDRVRAVSFRWNEKARTLGAQTGVRQIGVLAQEVERAFPELVVTPESATMDQPRANHTSETPAAEVQPLFRGDVEKTSYKAVNYGELTAVLLQAVKELQAENRALAQRIQTLESKAN